MSAALPVVRSVAELRARVKYWRDQGLTIALVPTMGALHRGHLSLVSHALDCADRVVVSIFVNPTQFGPHEDFSRYPRQEEQDAALLEEGGCHLLFAPTVAEMYPDGFATTVTVSGPADGLCGTVRPGHFAGVATVVTMLLLQAQPDVAVFGEKDYQQLAVIRRFARDLHIPATILGAPTLREADGLAPALYRELQGVAEGLRAGGQAAELCRTATARLLDSGFAAVDYVEVREAQTLAPMTILDRPVRILAAARLGKTRLIDNLGEAPAG